ncbi:DsbC family protein [Achromobacter sp. NPDC008082]|jgi:thiol:disulfide interchange protein DsbC|uniref:DsbC family protein n=1 Tax=Achromobacter sp. NPDC008082 TaxID=3363888 RepID=UPI0036E47FA8
MNFRISATLAACFLAGGLGLTATAHAQAPAKGDKAVSTQSVGQPGKGEKSVSTTQIDPVAEAVKERFQQRFTGMDVTTVRRTPYGLFEVQLGMDLIYTDEKVTWVMEGPLIDAMTRRDVTRESQEKLSAVTFDQLPLELAIKQVKGNGEKKVAIFEDPNCGYCKQLRHTMEELDNVTVYTFMYPILSPDSKTKVRDVWCAKDQGQAWDDWMVRGKKPATASCDVPEDKLLALGQQLMVRGTPTLFFADGSRVSGAIPLDQLKARLN